MELGYAPTGTDLALVVATGLGPTVLAESAWDAIVANWNRIPGAVPLPAPQPGPSISFPSLPDPITTVMWAELPRLALVESGERPVHEPRLLRRAGPRPPPRVDRAAPRKRHGGLPAIVRH